MEVGSEVLVGESGVDIHGEGVVELGLLVITAFSWGMGF